MCIRDSKYSARNYLPKTIRYQNHAQWSHLSNNLLISFFFEMNESMTLPANLKAESSTTINARNLELDSIDFFVRLMSMLGMPRSVGEIYGLLYFSKDSLPMDQIASRLGISIGSASQGLRTLRSLKAVRTAYVAGDRRDHYFAETEFRRLFSNFILSLIHI